MINIDNQHWKRYNGYCVVVCCFGVLRWCDVMVSVLIELIHQTSNPESDWCHDRVDVVL